MLHQTKFVIIHGPPRSGKDTMADLLISRLRKLSPPLEAVHRQVGQPLKDAAHGLLTGLHGNDPLETPNWDHFEEEKERPNKEFFLGQSPRQFYIELHECLLRPVFGDTVLAHMAVEWALNQDGEVDVVILSGWTGPADTEEIMRLGPGCVVIDLERPGTTWDTRRPFPSWVYNMRVNNRYEGLGAMISWIDTVLIPKLLTEES